MPEVDAVAARAVIENWLTQARSGGEHDVYESKRGNVRFSWDRPMELLVDEHIHYVYSRDISEAGIGLLCKFRMVAGDVAYVRGEEGEPWIRCRVAHATPTVGAFKVGAELVFDLE